MGRRERHMGGYAAHDFEFGAKALIPRGAASGGNGPGRRYIEIFAFGVVHCQTQSIPCPFAYLLKLAQAVKLFTEDFE